MKVMKEKDIACEKFIESLTRTERCYNELCRRTLLRLHELFTEKVSENAPLKQDVVIQSDRDKRHRRKQSPTSFLQEVKEERKDSARDSIDD